MVILSAKLIYFSPTRTTKKVVETVAEGMQVKTVVHVDLTNPDAGSRTLPDIWHEATIIGSPVYGGRLPADMVSRFRRIKGNNAPAVIVVVYGNRAYEDALLELRDLALDIGFMPIAAGAFIGEHSYSTDASPIAPGRPDSADLMRALEFGRTVLNKFNGVEMTDKPPRIQVPGNFPYKERSGLSNIAPVTNETDCTKCNECASRCPVAAIELREKVATDAGKCIRCCACVKICPAGARAMKDPRIRQVAEQLSVKCGMRREPETYFAEREA